MAFVTRRTVVVQVTDDAGKPTSRRLPVAGLSSLTMTVSPSTVSSADMSCSNLSGAPSTSRGKSALATTRCSARTRAFVAQLPSRGRLLGVGLDRLVSS